MDRISLILSKFDSQSIKANREWLEGCVSWFVAEDPSISLENLYKRTYDQWLLGDLQEVSLPSLPDSLFTDRQDAFELTGNFALQMNFVLEISESPYDQLRVLHNNILDATDEERIEQRQTVKKNRMLKLELTDGSRTISAMEHVPIACLSTKLVPGCKVLLRGPIRCVNRILFLIPGTIQVLGGELDTLLVTNAYENVLLKKLNKPTKTDPIKNYAEPTIVENRNNSSNRSRNTSRPANFNAPQLPADDPFNDTMDEDLMMTAALARVEEVERETNSQPNSRTVPPTSMNSAQDSRVRELLPDFHDFIDTSMLFGDDDAFDVDAIELNMQKSGEIFDSSYEFQFESAHLATIDQIQSKDIEIFSGKTMIIKAKFDAVVEKLRFIGTGEVTMSITIQDSWSRGKLRVQLSSSVMDKLLLYDCRELKEMFKRIHQQPQVKDEIQMVLDDLKEKIQKINSFIWVSYSNGFILQEILEPNSDLNAKFTSKIKKERLIVVVAR